MTQGTLSLKLQAVISLLSICSEFAPVLSVGQLSPPLISLSLFLCVRIVTGGGLQAYVILVNDIMCLTHSMCSINVRCYTFLSSFSLGTNSHFTSQAPLLFSAYFICLPVYIYILHILHICHTFHSSNVQFCQWLCFSTTCTVWTSKWQPLLLIQFLNLENWWAF